VFVEFELCEMMGDSESSRGYYEMAKAAGLDYNLSMV
jgi:hypothetical protein